MAALDGASSEALGIALLVLIPISLTQLVRVRSFYTTKWIMIKRFKDHQKHQAYLKEVSIRFSYSILISKIIPGPE